LYLFVKVSLLNALAHAWCVVLAKIYVQSKYLYLFAMEEVAVFAGSNQGRMGENGESLSFRLTIFLLTLITQIKSGCSH
jgi:hypothetical protein